MDEGLDGDCYSGLVLNLVRRRDGGNVILDPLCPLPVRAQGLEGGSEKG